MTQNTRAFAATMADKCVICAREKPEHAELIHEYEGGVFVDERKHPTPLCDGCGHHRNTNAHKRRCQ